MSDLMFYGVLQMPYEMVMGSELSRRQFYSRVQEAVQRLKDADRRAVPTSMPGAVDRDSVVEANRALLLQRSQVGIKKYGVTLADAGLSRRAIMQHLLEELLDAANYVQTDLQRQDAIPAAQEVPAAPQLRLTETQMHAIAKVIAKRVAKNAGVAPELCFAPALFALQDSFGAAPEVPAPAEKGKNKST